MQTCKCPVENCNLQVTSMEVSTMYKNKYYLEGGLAREQQNLPITVQIQNTQWSQTIFLYFRGFPCSFDPVYRPAPGINTNSKDPNSLWYELRRQYQAHMSSIPFSKSGIYIPVSYKQQINLGPNTKNRLRLKSQKNTQYLYQSGMKKNKSDTIMFNS
jgi:hypothetical protein